ncbi:hypothetical protein CEW46_29140, partial [Bacillus cereus]
EGYATDCIVTGNTISNYASGILVADAVDMGETFKYCGAIISNNTIKNFLYGVRVTKNAKKVYVDMGIEILGNVLNASNNAGAMCVQLTSYTRGVIVKDNIMTASLDGTAGRGVWTDYNVGDLKIINNKIRKANTGIFIRGTNETTITGGTVLYEELMNEFISCNTPMTIGAGCKRVDSLAHKFMRFIEMSTQSDNTYNNSLFIDSSDSKLKFRDKDGVVKIITLS